MDKRVAHSNSMLTRRAGVTHVGPLFTQDSGGGAASRPLAPRELRSIRRFAPHPSRGSGPPFGRCSNAARRILAAPADQPPHRVAAFVARLTPGFAAYQPAPRGQSFAPALLLGLRPRRSGRRRLCPRRSTRLSGRVVGALRLTPRFSLGPPFRRSPTLNQNAEILPLT